MRGKQLFLLSMVAGVVATAAALWLGIIKTSIGDSDGFLCKQAVIKEEDMRSAIQVCVGTPNCILNATEILTYTRLDRQRKQACGSHERDETPQSSKEEF